MLTTLYRSAVTWTVIGLVGGLAYRELTRSHEFVGRTQLAFVHTHALALGTTFLLLLLALSAALKLGADRRFRIGVLVWNIGLGITTACLAFKGTLQVLNPSVADSKAIAGVSGLGHITLTVAFVLVLIVIGARLKALPTSPTDSEQEDAPVQTAR